MVRSNNNRRRMRNPRNRSRRNNNRRNSNRGVIARTYNHRPQIPTRYPSLLSYGNCGVSSRLRSVVSVTCEISSSEKSFFVIADQVRVDSTVLLKSFRNLVLFYDEFLVKSVKGYFVPATKVDTTAQVGFSMIPDKLFDYSPARATASNYDNWLAYGYMTIKRASAIHTSMWKPSLISDLEYQDLDSDGKNGYNWFKCLFAYAGNPTDLASVGTKTAGKTQYLVGTLTFDCDVHLRGRNSASVPVLAENTPFEIRGTDGNFSLVPPSLGIGQPTPTTSAVEALSPTMELASQLGFHSLE